MNDTARSGIAPGVIQDPLLDTIDDLAFLDYRRIGLSLAEIWDELPRTASGREMRARSLLVSSAVNEPDGQEADVMWIAFHDGFAGLSARCDVLVAGLGKDSSWSISLISNGYVQWCDPARHATSV